VRCAPALLGRHLSPRRASASGRIGLGCSLSEPSSKNGISRLRAAPRLVRSMLESLRNGWMC
jgi:hypothetical protein